MSLTRRHFIRSGALTLASAGSLAEVILATSPAAAGHRRPFGGYGALVPDPSGLLDLPRGFRYRVFSREGDAMNGGVVPGAHDGMAAFPAPFGGTWLVRNHEIGRDDVDEDGMLPVPHVPGATYDPEGTGGTTTLLVGAHRRLVDHRVSLAGTITNCAGGPSPWGTWLTCEEDDSVLSKPHGYVFEVDPLRGGNPNPIRAMGRFEHEAVAFDHHGRAYLTEDADGPHGCFYRFAPRHSLRGRGSLHGGGVLSAMAVGGLDTDLSIIQTPGTKLPVSWVNVPNPDPGEDDASVREQVIALGATPIQKAEGVWTGNDGEIWFVSSRGDGRTPRTRKTSPRRCTPAKSGGIALATRASGSSRSSPQGPPSTVRTTSRRAPMGSQSPAPMARTTSGSWESPTRAPSFPSPRTRPATTSSRARRSRPTARPCS